MRTRHATLATLTLLAALTAACSTPATTTTASGEPDRADPRGQPPVVHVAGHELSPSALAGDTEVAPTEQPKQQQRGARVDPAAPAGPDGGDDPAAAQDPDDAAAGLLTDRLAAEGLVVTSIDTHLEHHVGDQAQVLIDVAHSPGHGHPVQSRYVLELARDAGGWRVVGFSEPS